MLDCFSVFKLSTWLSHDLTRIALTLPDHLHIKSIDLKPGEYVVKRRMAGSVSSGVSRICSPRLESSTGPNRG